MKPPAPFLAEGLHLWPTRDPAGWYCYKPHSSRWFPTTARKDMLRWINWPASTPSGQTLRQWLDAPEPPGAEPTDNTRTII